MLKMAAPRLAAVFDLIDHNAYQLHGEPCVSVRLGTRNFRPTVRATRLDPDDLRELLSAGGNLQFWLSDFYGPCLKIDRQRTVLLGRWLLDCQKGQGCTFLDKPHKLDLLRSNLTKNFMGARAAERPLMSEALAARGSYPLPIDLSRLVAPQDLVGPFEALA